MNKKFIDNVISSKVKYMNKKRIMKEDIPLNNRYFDLCFSEKREPLIKHPCVHWIGYHP
jgi:hypothetical protein